MACVCSVWVVVVWCWLNVERHSLGHLRTDSASSHVISGIIRPSIVDSANFVCAIVVVAARSCLFVARCDHRRSGRHVAPR